MRQQRGDQLLLAGTAGLGLKHQADCCVLARLVTHHIQHSQHGLFELNLVGAERFFTRLDFWVGDVFNFFQHPLRADARRQLLHHQLPLATRQLFNLPACANFERTTPRGVSRRDLGARGDDLSAARIVGTGHQRVQLLVSQLGRFDQRHAGISNFAQIVAGDFRRQAHGNPTGPVEQRERQARGQLARLVGRAVVVGHKVHRAIVNLVHQQTGDAGQPGFGVAHGGCAVAVAAAEIALPIDQRVALGKILRHAHQRVVSRLVAMRVKPAEHVTHHPGAFHRLGTTDTIGAAKTQAHARHAVQDASLHRFLSVTHIRQSPALDHTQGVFKISALRIGSQRIVVSHRSRRRQG